MVGEEATEISLGATVTPTGAQQALPLLRRRFSRRFDWHFRYHSYFAGTSTGASSRRRLHSRCLTGTSLPRGDSAGAPQSLPVQIRYGGGICNGIKAVETARAPV